MEELINDVKQNITSLKATITRNKKHYDYPFTTDCNHYYRLNQLHKELECWEKFLSLLLRYKSKRCIDIEFQSGTFMSITTIEKSTMPGFVTSKTLSQMFEYMQTLEWKIEELYGVWKKRKRYRI